MDEDRTLKYIICFCFYWAIIYHGSKKTIGITLQHPQLPISTPTDTLSHLPCFLIFFDTYKHLTYYIGHIFIGLPLNSPHCPLMLACILNKGEYLCIFCSWLCPAPRTVPGTLKALDTYLLNK